VRTELITAGGARVSLRRASPDDVDFLRRLYADRRAPELAAPGWPAAEQQALVDMQFAAQQAGYAAAFPDADHWVVALAGQPVGRLLVSRQGDEHRVVDIVVERGRRRLGIGTALLEEVMGDAAAAGVPVRLSALAHDAGTVAWYQRLGFVVAGARGIHLMLEWSPEPEGGLAAFRLVVLADTGLQQELLAEPDRRAFVARVVEEARARSCDVTPAQVEEALASSWRAWNRRWV
jgi:ribosomal protein S18 acetylase RimI-like enzyme